MIANECWNEGRRTEGGGGVEAGMEKRQEG